MCHVSHTSISCCFGCITFLSFLLSFMESQGRNSRFLAKIILLLSWVSSASWRACIIYRGTIILNLVALMPVIILDKLFQLVVCFPLSISIYFPPNNQLSKDLHRFYLNKPCTVHSSANITNASKTQLYFFLF